MKSQFIVLFDGESWGIEVHNLPILPIGSTIDIKLPDGWAFEDLAIEGYHYDNKGVMVINISSESSEQCLDFGTNRKYFKPDPVHLLCEYMYPEVIEFD